MMEKLALRNTLNLLQERIDQYAYFWRKKLLTFNKKKQKIDRDLSLVAQGIHW